MRSVTKIIFLLAFLLTPTYLHAAWAVVSHTCANQIGGGDGSDLTSGAINTTGASLLVVYAAACHGCTSVTFSDSASNTWTGLTNVADSQESRFWYASNPSISASHTFTEARSGVLFNAAFCVAAFSGAQVASPFDQQNTNFNSGSTTIATGSITPSQSGELIVAGVASGAENTTPSIDSGFTLVDSVAGDGHDLVGLAYLAQGAAAAINPTWTLESGDNQAAIASFKAAGASTRRPIAPVIFSRNTVVK